MFCFRIFVAINLTVNHILFNFLHIHSHVYSWEIFVLRMLQLYQHFILHYLLSYVRLYGSSVIIQARKIYDKQE